MRITMEQKGNDIMIKNGRPVTVEADSNQRMQAFIRNVRELGVITEFDETLWGLLVERVTVHSKDDIRVIFKK